MRGFCGVKGFGMGFAIQLAERTLMDMKTD